MAKEQTIMLDEELPYLIALLENEGSKEVPKEMISSYLSVQIVAAKQCGLHGMAMVLQDCVVRCDNKEHKAAREMLGAYMAGVAEKLTDLG